MFKHKLRYVFILLLSVYSFLNILIINEDRLYIFNIEKLPHFLNILLLITLIWEGNGLLQAKIPKLEKRKIHPLLIHFAISIVYIAILSTLSVVITIAILNNHASYFDNFKLNFGFTFRVNLFLNSVNAIFYYFEKLRQKERENEQLRTDTIEAKFEALSNQVNPHFLFNSLNVLSNLVYKDADASAEFIAKLSNVYRYVLNQQDKKLVELDEELEFIESYCHLVKIRFRDGVEINNEVVNGKHSHFIPPSSLQILIENAIKHNVTSKTQPLKIDIKQENNSYLIVENNLQTKTDVEDSNGIGLSNIKKRYQYLGSDKLKISQTNQKFIVKLPIIEID